MQMSSSQSKGRRMFFTEIGVEQFCIVLYISPSLRKIVQSRQRQQQKCKTEQDVLSFSCTFYRSYFFFYLYSSQPVYSNSFIFQIVNSEKKKHLLTLLVFPGLPHILTLIIDFIKHYVVIFSGCLAAKHSLAFQKDLK